MKELQIFRQVKNSIGGYSRPPSWNEYQSDLLRKRDPNQSKDRNTLTDREKGIDPLVGASVVGRGHSVDTIGSKDWYSRSQLRERR